MSTWKESSRVTLYLLGISHIMGLMDCYLGIDYGQKHWGVAVSLGALVKPLTSLDIRSRKQALRELEDLAKEYQIKGVVIGITDGILREEMKELGKELGDLLTTSIFYMEERDSTAEARYRARQAGKNMKTFSDMEHSWAAAVVLERWLGGNQESE